MIFHSEEKSFTGPSLLFLLKNPTDLPNKCLRWKTDVVVGEWQEKIEGWWLGWKRKSKLTLT